MCIISSSDLSFTLANRLSGIPPILLVLIRFIRWKCSLWEKKTKQMFIGILLGRRDVCVCVFSLVPIKTDRVESMTSHIWNDLKDTKYLWLIFLSFFFFLNAKKYLENIVKHGGPELLAIMILLKHYCFIDNNNLLLPLLLPCRYLHFHWGGFQHVSHMQYASLLPPFSHTGSSGLWSVVALVSTTKFWLKWFFYYYYFWRRKCVRVKWNRNDTCFQFYIHVQRKLKSSSTNRLQKAPNSHLCDWL